MTTGPATEMTGNKQLAMTYPKDPDPSKLAMDPTPAIPVQILPVDGQRSLGEFFHCFLFSWVWFLY